MYIPAQSHQATQFNILLYNLHSDTPTNKTSQHDDSTSSVSWSTDATIIPSSSSSPSTTTTPSTSRTPSPAPSRASSISSPSSLTTSSSPSSSPSRPALILDLDPVLKSSKAYAQSKAFTRLAPPTSNTRKLTANMLRRDSIELSHIRLNRTRSY